MQVYDHSYDANLEQFLKSAPRYRLVAISLKRDKLEPKALNMGSELTAAIEKMDRGNKTSFQFEVQEALMRIIHEHTFIDPEQPYYDSHCLNKDIPALISQAGECAPLMTSVHQINLNRKKEKATK